MTRGLDRPAGGDDDSAGRIAADVRAGRRRASAVHEAHVARHLATHGRINALVQPRHEASALEAAAVDRGPDGRLAGVPVSVKDCFPVRGLATSLGIRCRQAAVDTVDAAIVSALRQAGAVIVGKANVAQAMYLHETENPVYGRTVHPLDEDRGPGGSSGGDAALVAAGVVPLAVGTDLAGSLRQPAHACGVATLMPRSAVLGEGGAVDTLPTLQLVRPRAGFLARHVADLALATSVIAPTITSQAPVVRRVGWWDDSGPVSASPAIRRAVAEAVDRLSAAGVEMVALDAGIATEAAWLHLAMLAPGAADIRRLFGDERPQRGVARLLRLGSIPARLRPGAAVAAWLVGRRTEARALRATPGRGPEALAAARHDLAARFSACVAGCEAVVCPVSAVPALRHGNAAGLLLAASPCLLANLLDLPAGAVPVTTVRADEESSRPFAIDPVLRAAAMCDRGSRGLPVGVQVVAPPGGDEATVLEVMRLIERGG